MHFHKKRGYANALEVYERIAEMERLTVPDKKIDGGYQRAVIDTREVKKYAMKIYWELKKYEDTGLTPEQVQKLKDLDTAKEPTKDSDSGVRYTDDYICPNCGKHFTGTGIAEFCYHCGQRLKWEERLWGN